MAKPYKLLELEIQYGDLNEIIPKLVNEGGQKYAAFQLGTSQSTISEWLKLNGYKQNITYLKKEVKETP